MTYSYFSNEGGYRYIALNVLFGRALNLTEALIAQRRQDGSSKRPLFFIAHSLGGWIVKRALIISNEAVDPQLIDLELSTCGVAFFGTISPGRPSAPSPLAHVIRRTTPGVENDRKRNQTSAMELNDSDLEWLERQMEAFKGIATHLPRLSFYETKKSLHGFVAEQSQSVVGSGGTQIPMAADHSDLVKFNGRDSNYKSFIAKFSQMVDKNHISQLLESKRKLLWSVSRGLPSYRIVRFQQY